MKTSQNSRKLLFSVTAADCEWDYYRGSGKGGQKRNKTSNCVRCTHRESGAVATSEVYREQRRNREAAFRKMAETDTFRSWHRLETARRIGKPVVDLRPIEEVVEEWMQPENIKVEFYDPEEGK